MNKFLLSLSLALSAVVADAQTYSSTGPVAIPDGTGTCGAEGTPGVSSISVPLTGTIGTPSDVTINLNLTHAFVGDIRVELVAPDASVCILMNHIGATACVGAGITATNANTLSFNSTFTTPVPTTIDPVPGGSYAPTASAAFPAVGNLSTFLTGKSVNGTWSMRAVDNFGSLTGTISSWNISFGASALPLDLISFTGNTKGNYNQLRWETAVEKDVAVIELERNVNGVSFHTINSFLPQGSNSRYECNDQVNFEGVALYRLKIVERNGAFVYSPVLKLSNTSGGNGSAAGISPNPVKGNFVSLNAGTELIGTTAQLINAAGRLLQTIPINDARERIDISTYPSGIYYIRTEQGENLRFVKID